uniref:Uncharacterized protein n=1 Tax=viral metagenome TaxID=1070528 RepID=A0A6C0HVQ1_9ZZZZ
MNSKLTTFLGIMGFYILLSYLIGPLIFYYLFGKTLQAAGNGFLVGSILSILLWYFAGSKMV